METEGVRVSVLETPAVLIDLDLLDRNLKHTAELTKKAGVKLRPHFKTHKSIWIAKKQMSMGMRDHGRQAGRSRSFGTSGF